MTALLRRMDWVRARGRGQDDGGRGGDEVGAVVLAQGEDVQTCLVSQLDGFDEVTQTLGRAEHLAGGGVGRKLGERIDADFESVAAGGGSRRV